MELKKLSPDGIASAIERAEHCRLLNEPRQAESICLDVLDVDPENQPALRTLLLCLTDQFRRVSAAAVQHARELLPRLSGEYERVYFEGLICERWAKALLTRNHPGSGSHVYNLLREAMEHYDAAEKLRPPHVEDAILRWNSCVRLIRRHDHLEPEADEDFHPLLE